LRATLYRTTRTRTVVAQADGYRSTVRGVPLTLEKKSSARLRLTDAARCHSYSDAARRGACAPRRTRLHSPRLLAHITCCAAHCRRWRAQNAARMAGATNSSLHSPVFIDDDRYCLSALATGRCRGRGPFVDSVTMGGRYILSWFVARLSSAARLAHYCSLFRRPGLDSQNITSRELLDSLTHNRAVNIGRLLTPDCGCPGIRRLAEHL